MSHELIQSNIQQIKEEIGNTHLVVVSKYRSLPELDAVYASGHRDFGENRVQELVDKYEKMPKDIHWHVIGHLQTNKVKYIAPFVHMIHSIDSWKILAKVDSEAKKIERVIPFLFQLHIAQEDSKYGLTTAQLEEILISDEYKKFKNVSCMGLMGMATNTDNLSQVEQEFTHLKSIYESYAESHKWNILSMGMSGDYKLAVACGSSMVRVGSKIFI